MGAGGCGLLLSTRNQTQRDAIAALCQQKHDDLDTRLKEMAAEQRRCSAMLNTINSDNVALRGRIDGTAVAGDELAAAVRRFETRFEAQQKEAAASKEEQKGVLVDLQLQMSQFREVYERLNGMNGQLEQLEGFAARAAAEVADLRQRLMPPVMPPQPVGAAPQAAAQPAPGIAEQIAALSNAQRAYQEEFARRQRAAAAAGFQAPQGGL